MADRTKDRHKIKGGNRHKKVPCRYCKKEIRSDKMGSHLKNNHPTAKLTKIQKRQVKSKLKDQNKKIICLGCKKSMLVSNIARHRESCRGEDEPLTNSKHQLKPGRPFKAEDASASQDGALGRR